MPPLRKPTALHYPRRPGADDTVWLFDLDNTLHDCSRHIFQRIDSKMSDLIMEWLDLDRNEADALRLDYWKRYGATAAGL
ncbi:MAG: hydrolase, partial [Alcaligenaceae bacterium]|nr:hydrolase [Alcaligenaceae bacterium]